MKNNFKEKTAFTLAEVLITLGIIGVVSAITIPTLIKKYQTEAWDTSAKVFNQNLTEALKIMNTQQTLLGHNNTESFVAELSKHIKIVKICANNQLLDCFSEIVYWGGGTVPPKEIEMKYVKKSKNFGQESWESNIIGVQFANGTSALIAYNPITRSDDPTAITCDQNPLSNVANVKDCLAILYDTTGFKTPNTSGKDLRSINVTKLGRGCAFKIGETCYTLAPFNPAPVNKAECEAMIKTHGITSCSSDTDYWAGAVKKCGGINKMPSENQLGELADYIYNISGTGTSGPSNLTLTPSRVAELGLDFTNGLFIWAGKQKSNSQAFYRSFGTTLTRRYYKSRDEGSFQAICIGVED